MLLVRRVALQLIVSFGRRLRAPAILLGVKIMRTTITLPDSLHAALVQAAQSNRRELSAEITAQLLGRPAPGASKGFDYIGESKVIVLQTELPCSIRTPDGVCGKPATQAHASPVEITGPWAVVGAWMLQPICRDCATKAAALYQQSEGGR